MFVVVFTLKNMNHYFQSNDLPKTVTNYLHRVYNWVAFAQTEESIAYHESNKKKEKKKKAKRKIFIIVTPSED